MAFSFLTTPFSRSLWVAAVLTVLLGVVLAFEGMAARQVDPAYKTRDASRLLVQALRQSSEDLSRLAHTAVLTGDSADRVAYLNAVAAQEGLATALVRDEAAHPGEGQAIGDRKMEPIRAPLSLLDRMREAGFNDVELQHFQQATQASHALAMLEWKVISALDQRSQDPGQRQVAMELLRDASYRQAQQSVLQPLEAGRTVLDRRTAQALEEAHSNASFLRMALGAGGVFLLLVYAWTLRCLRRTLGGSTDDIHAQITRIGLCDVEEAIEVSPDLQPSVLGALALTKRNLKGLKEAQRQADAKLQRLTRLYTALSLSRRSILQCTDQRTLFEQVCRIAVESGGMRMAWVGVPNLQTRFMVPMARFGAGAESTESMDISLDPAQTEGQGVSVLVLESDQAVWCQDYQADPFLARWHPLSLKYQWAGLAAVPLHRDGAIMGIFYIYASERDAFDEETKRLLLEMGADFDAALRSLDQDTAQRQSREKEALGRFMLERLVSDSSLSDILSDFVLELERLMPGATCSILRLDEERQVIQPGAAPNLPDFYNAAIEGLSIGVGVGSCGTAMAIGQRVIVGDIASHPYWVDFKETAQRAGLGACWSEPIVSGAKAVLGSFAIYHDAPALPEPYELELIELAAQLSAIAIERKNAELQLQLEARVFEQGNEAIVITDSQRRIVRVNHAFSRITGFSEAEVLGKNPSMFSSGRQAADFYQGMWTSLDATDHWQGELWSRRKDGSVYAEWLSITALREKSGEVINYVGIGSDITQRKENEAQIQQLVNFDPLTGLPNRRLLQDRVKTALSQAQRANQTLALMFVDLDRFKNVNDSLGHHVGDELLVHVARRLVEVLRDQDTVARLGGDEFVLLCPQTDVVGAAHLAEKLLASVASRFSLAQQDLSVTFSIGVAMYPDDGDSFEALSMRADTAMYRAKHAGRNAYRFFTVEMQAESKRILQLENALSRALELNQLHLVYQPQISLERHQIVGVEALLRWQHPTLGHVSPAEFIPVAEESGLILPIGEWVLRTAVAQLRDWQDRGLAVPLMAVNLSAVQFRQANLPELVTRVLQDAGLAPECLELELTEGVAMGDPMGAMAVMKQLNQRGVRIAIDDFGTGYSSLSYLKRFSAHRLKIDQSFVRDITVDPDDKAIVVAIIALARSLGFRSIAEGVETPGQLAFLQEQGCDEVQGYLFSRPLNPEQFEAFFRDHAASIAISHASHPLPR